MTDLFDEVEGQLRSDRYQQLALKAAPWALGVAVLLIAVAFAVWGWRGHEQRTAAKASEAYAQGLDALSQGRTADAERRFAEVVKSAPKGYKALGLMQQGGLRMAAGKPQEAAALFDAAAKDAPDEIVGDAARLKSAFALMDSAPYKEMEARLTPLTEEGRPYRVEAREALAFAKLTAGDVTGARSDFVVISLLPDASEPARGRAEAAKLLIDSGSAKSVPALVKATAALPPMMQVPPGPAPAPQPQAPGPQ